MKIISRLVSSLAAIVALAFGTTANGQIAPGQAPAPDARPVVLFGGLTLQLSTSCYKVVQPRAADPGVVAANVLPQKASITASAALFNRSNSAITFTFPDGASAAAKFEFSLVNSDGAEVWHSDEGIGTQAITEETLKRGGVWRRVVRVPLVIEGTPLPVGSYTLLAFTDADKQVIAQTLLEIAPPATEPAKGKINGAVVKVVSTDPEVTEPVAGAWVTVQQLLDAAGLNGAHPFYWSGKADGSGKFAVELPAGRYRVTAGEYIVFVADPVPEGNVILPPPTYPPKSVEVSVAAGATVDVLIKLTKPPQPVAQGIKGLVVTAPPPQAGIALAEVPVARARVEVSEILTEGDPAAGANGGVIRVPFHWIGSTDNEGRFEVKTPVGKFHIVATKIVYDDPNAPVVQVQVAGAIGVFLPPPSTTLTGSADVAVELGKFSDVKITLKAANAPAPL